VIDDGLSQRADGCEYLQGITPFIYSRAINQAIAAAGTDDILALNDDCLLKTPGGFTLLAQAAEEHPEFGVISAVMTNVGNRNQFPHRTGGLRVEPRMVTYTAVYLPRATFEKVGPLDERFGGVDEQGRLRWGYDDDDHCFRIRRAGLKIGIHDGCLVDHGTLKSTARGHGHVSLDPGRDVFIKKWGVYPL
jgi:GT2 family glycosyltransferase